MPCNRLNTTHKSLLTMAYSAAPSTLCLTPIDPAGSKVLTWNPPDKRGSWADHGIEGIYVGPALDHFRAFRIWVPQTSVMRVSSTVWWFFPTFLPDDNLLTLQDPAISYPPTRERPHPQSNGADLLGRVFVEPELGACCITRLGPVAQKQMSSRAQKRVITDKAIAIGLHHTLHYQCIQTGEEYYSSVDEILQWRIRSGPILQPSVIIPGANTHVCVVTAFRPGSRRPAPRCTAATPT